MPPLMSESPPDGAGVGGLRLTLLGSNNQTLEGTIHIDNLDFLQRLAAGQLDPAQDTDVTTAVPDDDYDPEGASAYAVVVIFVYGFSIVLLIASHIFLKKKEDKKDGESEKEIDKYLEQASALQRTSEKESFRRLKHSIIPLVSVSMMMGNTSMNSARLAGTPGDRKVRSAPASFKSQGLETTSSRPLQTKAKAGVGSLVGSSSEGEEEHPLLPESPPRPGNKPLAYDKSPEPSPQPPQRIMPTILEGTENGSRSSSAAAKDIEDLERRESCVSIESLPWVSCTDEPSPSTSTPIRAPKPREPTVQNTIGTSRPVPGVHKAVKAGPGGPQLKSPLARILQPPPRPLTNNYPPPQPLLAPADGPSPSPPGQGRTFASGHNRQSHSPHRVTAGASPSLRPPHSLAPPGRPCHIIKCPQDLLNSDDEKLMQVTCL